MILKGLLPDSICIPHWLPGHTHRRCFQLVKCWRLRRSCHDIRHDVEIGSGRRSLRYLWT